MKIKALIVASVLCPETPQHNPTKVSLASEVLHRGGKWQFSPRFLSLSEIFEGTDDMNTGC